MENASIGRIFFISSGSNFLRKFGGEGGTPRSPERSEGRRRGPDLSADLQVKSRAGSRSDTSNGKKILRKNRRFCLKYRISASY